MFESSTSQRSLDESLFETWLENGRDHKLGYQYMLVIWDEYTEDFRPVYLFERADLNMYVSPQSEEVLAAYDLYSESRVELEH
ncbi:MAG: hypothetical protein R8G66_02565 [Cytophagales bacterium]|nr:hypothetical protein [Cytophagales bacterium]